MSLQQWFAIAAWVWVPMPALTQQLHYGAADGQASVTSVKYESAFKNYHSASEEDEPPDHVWRSANEEVGRLCGHAGHMKADAEAASSGAKMETHGRHHHD